MKSILICLVSILLFGTAKAQDTYDTTPPYQKDSTLPHFNLLRADSTWFNTAQIPKNTPVVITFFNPDCAHCQHTAELLAKNMKKLKKVYFIWATYIAPFEEINKFAQTYHLAKYSNVHFVKDVNYAIPSFYRLQMTPYMAAYNKHGHLVKTWPTGATARELIKLLH